AARIALLRAAGEADPAWTRVRLDLAPLLPPRGRTALLADGLRYEPQSAPLQWELGMAYAELGDAPRAEARLRAALRLDKWNSSRQAAVPELLLELAQLQLRQGKAALARGTARRALGLYADYAELVRQAPLLGTPANSRGFRMMPEAAAAAASLAELLDGWPVAAVIP
ncbi:hypothetical protein ACLBWT_15485, partial [Paenibacillus sp. D51F]